MVPSHVSWGRPAPILMEEQSEEGTLVYRTCGNTGVGCQGIVTTGVPAGLIGAYQRAVEEKNGLTGRESMNFVFILSRR